jgi:hypothetical protein
MNKSLPKYEAYIIKSRSNAICVHAFETLAKAEAAIFNHTLYKTGSMIAVVTSIESARAVLPVRASRVSRFPQTRLPDGIELWVC